MEKDQAKDNEIFEKDKASEAETNTNDNNESNEASESNETINSDKKTDKASQKKAFSVSKSTKAGSYTMVMTAILLAVLIVLNLIVNALPTKYTILDTSTNDMYTISETTEKYIKRLSDNVVIYYLCANGVVTPELDTFIGRYEGLSSKITVKVIDPVKDPTFLSKYTDLDLSDQSLIIESNKRYKIIDNTSMYYYFSTDYGKIAADNDYMLNLLTMYGVSLTLYFDGENVITSGIEYVITDMIPKAYILTGHGEATMSDMLLSAMDTYNIEYESLSLTASNTEIPANASCVIINNPLNDISNEEATILLAYLKSGGHLFVSTSYDDATMENLNTVMKYYGAEAIDGMVYEGNDSNYSTGFPYRIYPNINSTHSITADIYQNGYKAFMPQAHAIKINDDKRTSVTADILFSTSDSAFIKSPDDTDSASGTYALGVALSEISGDKTSKIVWFASADMLTDTYSAAVSYGNYYYYVYALTWMFDEFTPSFSQISGTSLSAPTLVVTEGQANFWSVMFIAIIPLAVVLPGLFFWLKRRRR